MPRQGHLTAEALTAFGLVLLPAGFLFAHLAPLPWAAYPMASAALLYALCRLLLMLLLGELRDEVAPSLVHLPIALFLGICAGPAGLVSLLLAETVCQWLGRVRRREEAGRYQRRAGVRRR